MNITEVSSETQNSESKRETSLNIPQQSIHLSFDLQQQVNLLNARANNANLAYSDLLREIDNTFKTMATTIEKLLKENVELRTKVKEAAKTQ